MLVCTAGCSKIEPTAKEKQKTAADDAGGRPETKMLRAADLAGYDGKAVRAAVDKVLDKNDEHQKELEKLLKQ